MDDGCRSICRHLRHRRIDSSAARPLQRDFFGSPSQIDRLGFEAALEGHTSCVNCLEWNRKGTLLASGSDDQKAIIWDAHAHKAKTVHSTGHDGNIFSVKFLPFSNDNLLATAAADCEVRLHDLQRQEVIQVFRCNENRVKRLATAPDTSYMFWSAAEDGTVRQYDMREPPDKRASTLINIQAKHRLEVKCISVNPIQPHLMAIGCSDPYVRVFDLRKLTPVASSSAYPYNAESPVHYFCPGHLKERVSNRRIRRYHNFAVTYVAWSPQGYELLVNLGAEQVYLYDILEPRKALYLESFNTLATSSSQNGMAAELANSEPMQVTGGETAFGREMSASALTLKSKGNSAFREQQYSKAISLYSEAMVHVANHPVLCANRAAAYLKRSWYGDVYAALRDCYTTLSLDPSNHKAHLRQANCLHQLKWHQLALDSIRRYQTRFPTFQEKSKTLAKQIEEDASKASGKQQPENGGKEAAASDVEAASSLERELQRTAIDFKGHFCGHCNTTTDIKEVSFIGGRSQYVAAGSDDGRFFIWEKATGRLCRVLKGDEAIVNCIQPHPDQLILATSGIDPVVRLWSPRPRGSPGLGDQYVASSINKIADDNQKRMRADPLELMLINMGMAIGDFGHGSASDDEDEEDEDIRRGRRPSPAGCQPS